MSGTYKFSQPDRRNSITMHSPTAAEGEDGVFTASIQWELVVDISSNPYEMLPDQVAGLFYAFLPLRGTIYHNGRPWVTCRSVKCDHVQGGVFTYTATYSDKNAEGGESGTKENPLWDRPIIKSIAGMRPLAIHKDRDGDAIMNKANDPIIQTVEYNTVGFKVEANVAYVPNWILSYRNTTNSKQFTIAGLSIAEDVARFVLESDFVEGPKSRNNVNYLVFRYTLLLDELDKHYGVPMNAGFNELIDGKQVPIKLKGGAEPDKERPLDDEGKHIKDPTPDNIITLEVKKYLQQDFSVLPGIK
jgi:hypothetical protein